MSEAIRYAHVLSSVLEHPWAVTASMRTVIADILARRIAGQNLSLHELEAALVNRKNLPHPTEGGAVAIIPMYGVIAPRMNMLSDISGGTTFEKLTGQLHEAMANPSVKTIVFDVDSPGGNVAGATEFAREVLKARTKKPVIAQAQYLMASAAYWVMACATEIVAAPSAMVGSVGVYTMHDDVSEALAKLGVKREVIAAGKYKAEAVDGGPLTAEAREHVQALVDDAHTRMIGDISKGRGIPMSAVRSGYGEGRAVSADEGVRLGMVDKVATLDETVARVMTAAPGMDRAALAAQDPATSFSGSAIKITSFGQQITSTSVTLQEPSQATSQERTSETRWTEEMERAFLELAL